MDRDLVRHEGPSARRLRPRRLLLVLALALLAALIGRAGSASAADERIAPEGDVRQVLALADRVLYRHDGQWMRVVDGHREPRPRDSAEGRGIVDRPRRRRPGGRHVQPLLGRPSSRPALVAVRRRARRRPPVRRRHERPLPCGVARGVALADRLRRDVLGDDRRSARSDGRDRRPARRPRGRRPAAPVVRGVLRWPGAGPARPLPRCRGGPRRPGHDLALRRSRPPLPRRGRLGRRRVRQPWSDRPRSGSHGVGHHGPLLGRRASVRAPAPDRHRDARTLRPEASHGVVATRAPASGIEAVALDGRHLYYANGDGVFKRRLRSPGTTAAPRNDDFADATEIGAARPVEVWGRVGTRRSSPASRASSRRRGRPGTRGGPPPHGVSTSGSPTDGSTACSGATGWAISRRSPRRHSARASAR